jgi:hypothetical protein
VGGLCEEGVARGGGLCEEGVARGGGLCEEGVARGGGLCEEGVARGGGLCEEGVARGGGLCEEGVAGHWAESRGREQGREREKRKGASRSTTRVFGRKMVYGKFFRKPFSFFLLRIFRSN